MLPQKIFEKWGFNKGIAYKFLPPSDPAMLSICVAIAIISYVHVVGIYIIVGGSAPLWNIGGAPVPFQPPFLCLYIY